MLAFGRKHKASFQVLKSTLASEHSGTSETGGDAMPTYVTAEWLFGFWFTTRFLLCEIVVLFWLIGCFNPDILLIFNTMPNNLLERTMFFMAHCIFLHTSTQSGAFWMETFSPSPPWHQGSEEDPGKILSTHTKAAETEKVSECCAGYRIGSSRCNLPLRY